MLYFYVFLPLCAQQIGMYSHYFYKPMIYNPAFTGAGDGTNAMLIHHTQWSDFKGAPQLNLFTLDKSFMRKKIGLGMGLTSDRKGINNRIGGNLFYAYRININDNTHISLGIAFGLIDQTLDYSKALVENASDPTLFPDTQHKTTYDGNAGFACVWKGLEFGAAVPQLFENKIKYDNTDIHAYYTHTRHYMGSLKYKFFLSKDKGISIAPQGLVRFVPNAPFQYDGGINFDWNDKFWIGATYKSDYAVAANTGFCIYKLFSVGYSYDIITGSIGKYSGMSHEIMVNFKLGRNKKTELKPVEKEPAEAEKQTPVAENKAVKVDTQTKVENKAPIQKPVVKESPKVEYFDYVAYRKHILDSLKELKAEMEKMRKSQPNPNNKNYKAIQNSADKTLYNKVWIATGKLLDFKDENNQSQTGFYVVVGSFQNRDYAKRFVQHLVKEGFKTAKWIYCERTKFNYVFIKRVITKEEAFKQANNAKVAGYEDVWVQRIE